jgi:hypothetical protein
MPLTHDFKETIRARARAEPEFRGALLREAVECIIAGDLATGKAVLGDYVNATVGFQVLEKLPIYRQRASCACWALRVVRRLKISRLFSRRCNAPSECVSLF